MDIFYGCLLTELEIERLFKNSLSFCACDCQYRNRELHPKSQSLYQKFTLACAEFPSALSSTYVVLTRSIKIQVRLMRF